MPEIITTINFEQDKALFLVKKCKTLTEELTETIRNLRWNLCGNLRVQNEEVKTD